MHNYHRVWAEVNLDAIRANMESFRDNVPKEAMLCGVIKTDGYGLGAVPVAKTIDDLVWGYAVATIDEALNLRRHNITKPILVLGYVHPESFADLVDHKIRRYGNEPHWHDTRACTFFCKMAFNSGEYLYRGYFYSYGNC